MKVSVLVTFFNQAQYVDQALQSVAEQETDFEYEVLIGDDGSTDGTVEKLRQWERRHPGLMKVFVRDREPGLPPTPLTARQRASANRIALLRAARGDYFTLLDGDDCYCDRRKLQIQADLLDDPANSDCVGCAHNVEKFWDDGSESVLVNNAAMKPQKVVAERYFGCLYFCSAGLMYKNLFRRRDPEKIFGRFNLGECALAGWLLKFGGFFYIPRVMSRYRQHHQSICAGFDRLRFEIGNLSVYSFDRRQHPDFRGAVNWRYRHILATAYKNLARLKSPDFDDFRRQAEMDRDEESLKWLNYHSLSRPRKALFHWSYWRARLSAASFRVLKNSYFKPGSPPEPARAD